MRLENSATTAALSRDGCFSPTVHLTLSLKLQFLFLIAFLFHSIYLFFLIATETILLYNIKKRIINIRWQSYSCDVRTTQAIVQPSKEGTDLSSYSDNAASTNKYILLAKKNQHNWPFYPSIWICRFLSPYLYVQIGQSFIVT